MEPITQLLRDGSTVADPRLTRLQHFDERSREYPVRELLPAGQVGRSYTWRCDAHLDQGREGACVGFSLAHELVGRPACVTGIDGQFARERIYWEAQRIDPWPGGAYPGAEQSYEGTSVLAGVKVCQRLGYIREYRWAFSIRDLAGAVGHIGPAVLGIPWYEGMYGPLPCGHLHPTGALVGGHAILCKGVNVRRRTFTLHNSWGSSWGDHGSALISWDELDRLLHEGGEACIPVLRVRDPG